MGCQVAGKPTRLQPDLLIGQCFRLEDGRPRPDRISATLEALRVCRVVKLVLSRLELDTHHRGDVRPALSAGGAHRGYRHVGIELQRRVWYLVELSNRILRPSITPPGHATPLDRHPEHHPPH